MKTKWLLPFSFLYLYMYLIDPAVSFSRNASLGSNCDPKFESEYASPIYKTEDLVSLQKALKEWETAASRAEREGHPGGTCISIKNPPTYNPHQGDYFHECNAKTRKCDCHWGEPLSHLLIDGKCEFPAPRLGSSCDARKGKEVMETDKKPGGVYHMMQNFQTRGAFHLNGIVQIFAYFPATLRFPPWMVHRLCHTKDKNLACSSQGKCECLNVPPYFVYHPDESGNGSCAGILNSVCKVAQYVENDFVGKYLWTLQEAKCFTTKCAPGPDHPSYVLASFKDQIHICQGKYLPRGQTTTLAGNFMGQRLVTYLFVILPLFYHF